MDRGGVDPACRRGPCRGSDPCTRLSTALSFAERSLAPFAFGGYCAMIAPGAAATPRAGPSDDVDDVGDAFVIRTAHRGNASRRMCSSQELRDGSVLLGPPKTRAGVRTLALPELLVVEIEDHLEWFVDTEPEARLFRAGTVGGCGGSSGSASGPGRRRRCQICPPASARTICATRPTRSRRPRARAPWSSCTGSGTRRRMPPCVISTPPRTVTVPSPTWWASSSGPPPSGSGESPRVHLAWPMAQTGRLHRLGVQTVTRSVRAIRGGFKSLACTASSEYTRHCYGGCRTGKG